MNYLITGAAGFIGSHLAKKLCLGGANVIGIDNLSNYYSVELKKDRLKRIKSRKFNFMNISITDYQSLKNLFKQYEFDAVINLAAQPGVCYSITNPEIYIETNVVGFSNIIKLCVKHKIKHLIFASSSSVYGANTKMPFKEDSKTEHPLSLYAATKKSNELIAYSYASTHKLACTGIRYFTVYGPWGRPDMAVFKFADHIASGLTINLRNNGQMKRNFTYIDDAIDATLLAMQHLPSPNNLSVPYQIFNIAGSETIQLLDLIKKLEVCLGKKAICTFSDDYIGEMLETSADTAKLKQLLFDPKISFNEGCELFIKWYLEYNAGK